MKNVEFKAELRDLPLARTLCRLAGARELGRFEQRDHYFRMFDGRLKQRVVAGQPDEWIFYHRKDAMGPRLSNYTILTSEQAATRWGADRLHPWLTVAKQREVWLIDNTRIHLDDVESLGRFIEFEAVVGEKYDEAECRKIVIELREAFGPALGEPISSSYSDMLARLGGEA